MRACVEPEALRAAFSSFDDFDVARLAGQLTTPTLVLHNRANRWLPVRVGQRLAASIRGARFLEIDDLMYEDVPRLVADFISETGVIGDAEAPEIPSGTAVILFADIAGSTALTERLGDAAFREKARGLDAALRTVMRENGGTPIEGKLLGDGVLAVFTSARQAIEATLRCGRAGDDAGLPLHLGLHAGDVIREENNVYGGAVNIAARVSALSAPGEVLVSDTVRSLARTSAGVRFEDRGERELKGVSEPVRVYEVRWRADEAPT
jgi:class 3 adenylate cyclase